MFEHKIRPYISIFIVIIIIILLTQSVSANSTGKSASGAPIIYSNPYNYSITSSTLTGSTVSNSNMLFSWDGHSTRTSKIYNLVDAGATSDLTIGGGMTAGGVSGLRANGTYFDGINDYGWGNLTSYTTTAGSVRAVVNLNKLTNSQYLVEMGNRQPRMYIFSNSFYINFKSATGGAFSGEQIYVPITTGEHEFLFTWTSTSYRLYVDGVEKQNYSSGCSFSSSAVTLKLGMGANYFQGSFYECMIWSRSLTKEEAQILYNSAHVASTNACISYSYLPSADQAITTWSLLTNSTGLSINSGNGAISGSINSIGSYYLNLTATNANGYGWQNYTLRSLKTSITSIICSPPLTLDELSPYSVTVTYDQSVSSTMSTLGAWLSFDGTTVTGTPNGIQSGTYVISIHAWNANGHTWSNWTLVVANSYTMTITGTPVLALNETNPYSVDFSCDRTVTWTLTTDAAWLSWDGVKISGTPDIDQAGSYAVSLHASGVDGDAWENYTITVGEMGADEYINWIAPLFGIIMITVIILWVIDMPERWKR